MRAIIFILDKDLYSFIYFNSIYLVCMIDYLSLDIVSIHKCLILSDLFATFFFYIASCVWAVHLIRCHLLCLYTLHLMCEPLLCLHIALRMISLDHIVGLFAWLYALYVSVSLARQWVLAYTMPVPPLVGHNEDNWTNLVVKLDGSRLSVWHIRWCDEDQWPEPMENEWRKPIEKPMEKEEEENKWFRKWKVLWINKWKFNPTTNGHWFLPIFFWWWFRNVLSK